MTNGEKKDQQWWMAISHFAQMCAIWKMSQHSITGVISFHEILHQNDEIGTFDDETTLKLKRFHNKDGNPFMD